MRGQNLLYGEKSKTLAKRKSRRQQLFSKKQQARFRLPSQAIWEEATRDGLSDRAIEELCLSEQEIREIKDSGGAALNYGRFLEILYSGTVRVRLESQLEGEPEAAKERNPKPGDWATLQGFDAFGSAMVKWDNGSSLNLVPEDDYTLHLGEQ
jgi:hypothetical protein